jgi:hypothetical protein
LLYVTVNTSRGKQLVRWNLDTLESQVLFDWKDIPTNNLLAFPASGLATVSADHRYGLTAARLGFDDFGIARVDLSSGAWEIIHTNRSICNPHAQYSLGEPYHILVQENRGCRTDEKGNLVVNCDATGAGLYTVDAHGASRRDFPVAAPHTVGTTGHECWIGTGESVLVTLTGAYNDGTRSGNVLEVCHQWEKPRVVFDTPHTWNHISVSRCGRFFVADSYQLPGVAILVGSIATGRTQVLFEAHTSGGGPQYSHAHPYFTSDAGYVVFNSDRTGISQTYLASVPDGLLEGLDK